MNQHKNEDPSTPSRLTPPDSTPGATPQEVSSNNQAKRYRVTLHRTDYLWCDVEVVATDEASAADLGEALTDQQWKVADRELYVYETCEIEEGGDHA